MKFGGVESMEGKLYLFIYLLHCADSFCEITVRVAYIYMDSCGKGDFTFRYLSFNNFNLVLFILAVVLKM